MHVLAPRMRDGYASAWTVVGRAVARITLSASEGRRPPAYGRESALDAPAPTSAAPAPAPWVPSRDIPPVLLVVAIAALLRLWRLDATPGWDGDEGYNLNIAWHLSQGRAQMFALQNAFVQHPPLFYLLLVPAVAAVGPQVVVTRALAALSGVLTAAVVYVVAVSWGGRRLALLAAVAFAILPAAVLHNRLGYTYNLLLLWSALTLWLVQRYETSRRGPKVAALCGGLGWATDQEGIFLVLFVALRAARAGVGPGITAIVWSLLPWTAYALAFFALQPRGFLSDVAHAIARVSGGSWPEQLTAWLTAYMHLLEMGWWWPAAAVGLFLIPERAARVRVLLLAGLMLLVILKVRDVTPFFRTAIPLFLPASLGIGALLDAGIFEVYRLVVVTDAPAGGSGSGLPVDAPSHHPVRRLAAATLIAFVLFLPLAWAGAQSLAGIVFGFQTQFDWALARDQGSARAATAFVNARRSEADLVLLSPHIAWLVHGRTADLFQAAAYDGRAVAFYPPGLPRSRFVYPCGVGDARFVVLDRFWDAWAADVPVISELVALVQRWPLVFTAGGYRVHERPG